MPKVKKKIFHIITGFSGGGSESMLSNLVKLNRYYNYTIICLKKKDNKYEKKIKNIIYLNITKNPISIIFGFFKLINIIKKNYPDVIMTWLYHADFIGYVACKLLKFPTSKLIWNLRCAYMTPSNLPFTTLIIRYFLSKVSSDIGTILCNSFESLRFHKSINYKNNHWKVIPNGFDLIKFKKNFRLEKILKKKYTILTHKVICMIARNEPQKDFYFFLNLMQHFKNKYNIKIKILLIGKGTENIKINNFLKNDIIKLGYLNNLNNILNIVDILILISKGESFPNVVGEAMCMNIPCITNNVGDCKRIIGKTGFVINKPSFEKFIDKIAGILNKKFVILNGRSRIKKHFNIKDVCKSYSNLFLRIK